MFHCGRCTDTYNSFLTTAHAFIAWRIFGAFLWDEVGGVERLRDFLEIEKDSSRGRAQLAMACIMCIMYTAGYPLFLVYHLRRTNWGVDIDEQKELPLKKARNHILGHLVDDYEKDKRHYVIYEMAIKLLQVIVLRFAQTLTAQSIVFTILLLTHFGMRFLKAPYRVEVDDEQREVNRQEVEKAFKSHYHQVGLWSSLKDRSMFRYIYSILSSLQLKRQVSALMFTLALFILFMGFVSIGLDDSLAVGVFTLLAVVSMFIVCLVFSFRALRAREKLEQLDGFLTQDRPVAETELAAASFEEELEGNRVYQSESIDCTSPSTQAFVSAQTN